MMKATLEENQQQQEPLEVGVDGLAELIENLFPAEAASADLADRKQVLRLAKDLLERLWRWEH